MKHSGSCHCGAIKFEFEAPEITEGLKCNCSICRRKGATMTAFAIPKSEVKIVAGEGALATYQFGSCVAKHHFCKRCGIYPFHETLRKPGHMRFNIGCLDSTDGVDVAELPFDVFDGASL
ncbi:GFA family protein [Corallincola platygyrae]|uniref:GFA family protein n=1 Tax=Corallincola platygyrae TaxID=1193278 RepID=A0ABW4XLW0_9GAMM